MHPIPSEKGSYSERKELSPLGSAVSFLLGKIPFQKGDKSLLNTVTSPENVSIFLNIRLLKFTILKVVVVSPRLFY